MGVLTTWSLLMTLPERLIILRRDNALTQQAMADAVGIHVTQIKRYELGQSQPSLDVLKKIAVALSISADSLLFDEGERGPDDRLMLQFEALSQFDDEDRLIAQGVLEGLILKHQAKQSLHRQQAAKK
jgi:transcriptional regulator with XRE-family HTH domain